MSSFFNEDELRMTSDEVGERIASVDGVEYDKFKYTSMRYILNLKGDFKFITVVTIMVINY
jgi:hypothetical protein